MTPTIAIVDDEPDLLRIVRSLLVAEDYDVRAYGSGAQLVDALDQGLTPSLFFLDIMMPGMDGFAVCAEIRLRASLNDTPVVFLTAMHAREAHDRALACGADDFLEKPVRRTELIARTRSLLRLSATSKALRAQHNLLVQQNAALQLARSSQRDLSAMVVHDLKNPLAALRMNVAYLQKSAGTEDTRAACSESSELVDLMFGRVMSILDLARADAGKLTPHLSRVAVRPLLERVAARERSQAEARGLSLSVAAEEGLCVMADPELLTRVLENLVDNAMRYAPKGSCVNLRVSCGDTVATIEVEDKGLGVAPEQLGLIFAAFSQSEGAPRVTGHNVGLGLAFCKAAVDAQGGSIVAKPAFPHGLCVSVQMRKA